jgi:hypothetical protein
MGRYLNPDNRLFEKNISSSDVDATGLIQYTNSVLKTLQKYVYVTCPQKYVKTMIVNMLVSYYTRGADSAHQFKNLKIAQDKFFEKYLNQYNVIFLNIQEFLNRAHAVNKVDELIRECLLEELLEQYPDIDYFDETNLSLVLVDIYNKYEIPFVFVIDEWDCVFERNENAENLYSYLNLLNCLLKDRVYVGLAYMTGVSSINEHNTNFRLNMFDVFSMTKPRQLAKYIDFTEFDVQL